ncbi:hypothetical protein SAMN04487895_11189 [Paenibacillus sophorae]|uniref:Uncharacterized protein n=1 Tax=Paenibacillus sophorae TaxID=1333845 RepID=A0A1H8SBD5_9BACL|nr:hypothetical protein [Paenibacillus sophorae]QWU16796.1 hypothetical protein KP014_06185 [Paenibacillus sophorae]SEO75885.1 hypothetical protein SAMN04487895_11189 [Paenibacillus sophorae]
MKRWLSVWGFFIAFGLFLAFDLWKNYSPNASEFFTKWVKPVFDTWRLPVVVYLFLTIGLIQFFRDRIGKLENESNEELSLYIKANRHYSNFRRLELLQSVIRKFVEHQESVDAVQMYKYEIKKRINEIIVKVKHVDGFVYEGVELNALGQIYFHVERDLYRDFMNAKAYLERHNDASKLISFVRTHRLRINGVNPEDVGEKEATDFAILQLAVDLIEEWFQEVFNTTESLNLFNLSQEMFIKLNEVKRTGILRAVLLKNDYYRFSHYGSGEKQGRLYIGRHILLGGINHCFLITLGHGIFDEENALELLAEVQNEFIDEVQSNFGMMYNNNTDNREGDRHEEAQ